MLRVSDLINWDFFAIFAILLASQNISWADAGIDRDSGS